MAWAHWVEQWARLLVQSSLIWLHNNAAVVALAISLGSIWLSGRTERNRRRREARGVAVSIYPYLLLLEIRGNNARVELEKLAAPGYPPTIATSDIWTKSEVAMPDSITRNADNLYKLGGRAGDTAISVLMTFDLYHISLREISERAAIADRADLEQGIQSLIEQLSLAVQVAAQAARLIEPMHNAPIGWMKRIWRLLGGATPPATKP